MDNTMIQMNCGRIQVDNGKTQMETKCMNAPN